MVEKSIRDLINRKIDGVLTPEEEVRLAEHLAANAEARILLDDLSQQGMLVQQMGEVEPPLSLKPSIMRAIQLPAHGTRRSWIPDAVARVFETRKRTHYAFAFSGGVVAGMLIVAAGLGILRPGALVESDAAGTSIIDSAPPGFRTLEERDISSGQVQGKISTAIGAREQRIVVQLQGPENSRVQLVLQPETVHVAEVERLDGTPPDYTILRGEVELRGPVAYRLILHGAASLRVKVTSAGKNAYEGDFLLHQ
jgi:hypothetical protein